MGDKENKGGDGLRGPDQQQDDLQDSDSGRELPEGLKRERKGPLNPTTGRHRQSPRETA
jgi:hypothetical protein